MTMERPSMPSQAMSTPARPLKSRLPLEYQGASRLPVVVVAESTTDKLPINLDMLRSGFQFEPELPKMAEADEGPLRKRSTSERLREFYDKTLRAVASAATSRPRANTTHTCGASEPTAPQEAEAHMQRDNQSSASTASPVSVASTDAQHYYHHEWPEQVSAAGATSPHRYQRSRGKTMHASPSSRLEGRLLVRDPDGQHTPSTIVNHAFLRSGAQFVSSGGGVDVRRSNMLGVSTQHAAAGDQNEMHLHKSKNRRLEEFYIRMQQQHYSGGAK